MAKEVLTVSGVAIRYALGESKVRHLADTGVIPCIRDNTNKRVFDAEQVAKALRPIRLGVK